MAQEGCIRSGNIPEPTNRVKTNKTVRNRTFAWPFTAIVPAKGSSLSNKSMPVGQALDSLPPKQRAERYRQFASDVMQKAQAAQHPDQKTEYLAMASGWHAMAVESELLATLDEGTIALSVVPEPEPIALDSK